MSNVKDRIRKAHYFHDATASSGLRAPHYRAPRSLSGTSQSVGVLWTSDQSEAKTSVSKNTTLAGDRHPCSRRDSKPRSNKQTYLDPHLGLRGHGGRHWLHITKCKNFLLKREHRHIIILTVVDLQCSTLWTLSWLWKYGGSFSSISAVDGSNLLVLWSSLFTPRERTLATTGQEPEWASRSVWLYRRRQGPGPDFPSMQSSSLITTQAAEIGNW